MYVSGFSCTPFDSISVISTFWVQMSPAVRTQWTTPLATFVECMDVVTTMTLLMAHAPQFCHLLFELLTMSLVYY